MKKLILILSAIALSLSSVNVSLATFKDVPETHPNYAAINYVQGQNIVQGYPDGTYQADKEIDRYEFTKIIVGATFTKEEINACKTSPFKDVPMDWFTPYVCLAEKEGIVGGYPDGTFQGTNKIKLVEAAKIIVNGFDYPVQEDLVTWYKPYIMKLEELKALPITLKGFEHLITRGEMAEKIFRLDVGIKDKSSTTYNNLENGIMVKEEPSEFDNAIALVDKYRKCENAKTIPFTYNETLDAHYGSFTWKGKIVSREESYGEVLYFVVEDDGGLAFDYYKKIAELRNNNGPTRYENGKILFALGGMDGGEFVSWAEINDENKALILSKSDKDEEVSLNLAQIYFVGGGGEYEASMTETCFVEAEASSNANMASNEPVTGNHIFYTSSYYTSEQYYCDTDPAWKNLSPDYLQSYPSEAELLKVYPYKTLNQAC